MMAVFGLSVALSTLVWSSWVVSGPHLPRWACQRYRLSDGFALQSILQLVKFKHLLISGRGWKVQPGLLGSWLPLPDLYLCQSFKSAFESIVVFTIWQKWWSRLSVRWDSGGLASRLESWGLASPSWSLHHDLNLLRQHSKYSLNRSHCFTAWRRCCLGEKVLNWPAPPFSSASPVCSNGTWSHGPR